MRTILLISLLLPSLVCAETSLWRVSQGDHELYVGGTLHLLSKSDYPLPDEFEQVFRTSDLLVLETDLDALSKPKAQAQLMQSLMYTDDTTLDSTIKPKTYKALARHCKISGLSMAAMQKMKPAMVVLTLTMTELKRLGLAGAGVDQFFFKKAQAKGKKITGLETAETQINTLATMAKGRENELILATIKEFKKTPDFVGGMKKAWRSGDLSELEKIGVKAMQAEFPGLNQSLLTARNIAWLPKIKVMLTTPERELILVGTLHLVGKDGLIAQLKKQGYAVEQY